MIHTLLLTCVFTLALNAQEQQPAQQSIQQSEPMIEDHDQLLAVVKQNRQQLLKEIELREKKFLQAKDQQEALLAKAKKEYERSQVQNNPLKKLTQSNSKTIEQLQQDLQQRKTEMGDIYSIFKQAASDFSTSLKSSMVSVEKPQRHDFLQGLIASEKLATIDQMEQLWLTVQDEMTESGKIQQSSLPVVSKSGKIEMQQVTRIGRFTAYADSSFLRYVPQTQELLAIERQPSNYLIDQADRFVQSNNELLPILVDPSGGDLLGLISYTPTVAERIQQAGIIGYIILGLGAFGILITLWRGIFLSWVHFGIRRQLKTLQQPSNSNPLGRVLLKADEYDHQYLDGDTLQFTLNEAILGEIPSLERSHNFLKLIAVTAPLLGLLGTVTGMILTFQAISLFGSNDPKLMAGGISQALMTTVLGLCVAIPLLFGHSIVTSLAENMIKRLDEQSSGLIARLLEGKNKNQKKNQNHE